MRIPSKIRFISAVEVRVVEPARERVGIGLGGVRPTDASEQAVLVVKSVVHSTVALVRGQSAGREEGEILLRVIVQFQRLIGRRKEARDFGRGRIHHGLGDLVIRKRQSSVCRVAGTTIREAFCGGRIENLVVKRGLAGLRIRSE